MFEKSSIRICKRLALREIRFHKVRSFLTILVGILVTAIFSFVLFLSSSIKKSYESDLRYNSNTLSDVVFTDLTMEQAERLAEMPNIKEAVWYRPVGKAAVEGQQFDLAVYQEGYARSVEAVPDRGRLPENENEIAMDKAAAFLLGGTSKLGSRILLNWTPEKTDTLVRQEFTLVGTWEPSMINSQLWIAEGLAEKYPVLLDTGNVTAGVTLWRPGNIAKTAKALAASIGMEDSAGYTTSIIYDDYQIRFVRHYVNPVLANDLVVFLCGFLMFFAIFQMSMELDVRFYGRMKAIGMTAFQMRRVVYYWAGILVMCSVPFGWILGYLLNQWIFPRLYFGAALVYPVKDFVLSLLAVGLAVFLACIRPAWRVSRLAPAEAVKLAEPTGKRKKQARLDHHRSNLLKMAVSGMVRQKARIFFSIAALAVAAMFSCAAAVQFLSFDEKTANGTRVSFDYLLYGEQQGYSGFYQQEDASLSPELYRDLKKLAGKDNITRVYRSVETEMVLKDSLYEKIMGYYDEEHLKYFSDNYLYTGFEEAYQRMKDTHRIPVVVYGADNLMMQAVTNPLFHFTGEYDEQRFETGDYAFVAGIHVNQNYPLTDYQPVPEDGSTVEVFGKSFQIMGSCTRPPNSVICPPENQIALELYIPADTFLKLFPGANLLEICLNVPEGKTAEVEHKINDYQDESGYSLGIVEKQQFVEGFKIFIWTMSGHKIILSAVLFLIAILGFINLILHRTLARSREFAVYRSLGMSRFELRKLLVMESVLHTIFSACFLYPLSVLAAGPVMKWYYATGPEWAYTYHFTILPAHILVGVLLALAVVLPPVCVWLTEKQSVTQRLNLNE